MNPHDTAVRPQDSQMMTKSWATSAHANTTPLTVVPGSATPAAEHQLQSTTTQTLDQYRRNTHVVVLPDAFHGAALVPESNTGPFQHPTPPTHRRPTTTSYSPSKTSASSGPRTRTSPPPTTNEPIGDRKPGTSYPQNHPLSAWLLITRGLVVANR